jgi:hypothetical protein
MLIREKLEGKWNSELKRFEFLPGERILYRGEFAEAKGGSSTTTTVPTAPWSVQQPYIRQLFNEASTLYEGGPPAYYGGDLTAGSNPMLDASQQAGQAQLQASQGQNATGADLLLGSAQTAGSNPSLQAGVSLQPQMTQSIGQLLSGGNAVSGTANAALPALFSSLYGGSTPTAAAGVDPTQAISTALNSNGMNPYTDAIVNGALRSSNNQFATSTMPQIRSAAQQVNQVGGSRQGIAEGLAARDLTTQQGDIISRLYGSAFDAGSADRNNAMQLVTQAQQAGQTNQTQRSLAGGQLAGNLLTSGAQLGQEGMQSGVNASANLLQGGQTQQLNQLIQSLQLLPTLQQSTMGQTGVVNQLGQQQYAMDNASIQALMDRFFYNQNAPYNALTQFQNYINGPYGSSLA